MPSTVSRGVKRKYSSLPTEGDHAKVIRKLFHGLKEVKKAARKTKSFETQKIVKRLKSSGASLEKKNADKLVLEAELNALKTIDHDRIATLALKSKLKKDKLLSSDPSIQSAVSKTFLPDAIPASEGMAAKLESRLLSSKTLSKAVNIVISSLYSALKPDEDEESGAHKASGRHHETVFSVVAEQQGTPEPSEDNSGDLDDDENGSTDTARNGDPLHPSTSFLHQRSPSESDRATPSLLLPDGSPQTLGAESSFLSTLSNGFIPGGSDTDWSDGEARAADGVLTSRIWEKKYGKGAKHLQKLEQSGAIHDAHTPRRHSKGPQANPRPRLPGSFKQTLRANNVEDISKHTSHQRKSRAVDDRPLHPSWVAKMRMKERSSAVIVPSQGKRIKFDQ
ncbi:BUD22-domain-containing protein [Russula compacta]|nr:BUD22-domain-containing protein [Russula compacta]